MFAHVGLTSWAEVGPMLALGPLMLAYVGPMLRHHDPPRPDMFAHVDPTWAEVGPMLALGPPYVGLCWPYVAPS